MRPKERRGKINRLSDPKKVAVEEEVKLYEEN
jgi:hypothetical protein